MKIKLIYISTILGLLVVTISTYAADNEFALKIRESNPEYGYKIPKELCKSKKLNPCEMSTNLMIKPIINIQNTKNNLTNAAWSALKSNASAGQEIWKYNLCQNKWSKKEPCVPVYGYAVLRKNNVVFYTFFKN